MVKLIRSLFNKLSEQNAEDLKPFYGEKIIPNPMPKNVTYLRLSASICVHLRLKNTTSSRNPENPKKHSM
jgi:hypothetical protein